MKLWTARIAEKKTFLDVNFLDYDGFPYEQRLRSCSSEPDFGKLGGELDSIMVDEISGVVGNAVGPELHVKDTCSEISDSASTMEPPDNRSNPESEDSPSSPKMSNSTLQADDVQTWDSECSMKNRRKARRSKGQRSRFCNFESESLCRQIEKSPHDFDIDVNAPICGSPNFVSEQQLDEPQIPQSPIHFRIECANSFLEDKFPIYLAILETTQPARYFTFVRHPTNADRLLAQQWIFTNDLPQKKTIKSHREVASALGGKLDFVIVKLDSTEPQIFSHFVSGDATQKPRSKGMKKKKNVSNSVKDFIEHAKVASCDHNTQTANPRSEATDAGLKDVVVGSIIKNCDSPYYRIKWEARKIDKKGSCEDSSCKPGVIDLDQACIDGLVSQFPFYITTPFPTSAPRVVTVKDQMLELSSPLDDVKLVWDDLPLPSDQNLVEKSERPFPEKWFVTDKDENSSALETLVSEPIYAIDEGEAPEQNNKAKRGSKKEQFHRLVFRGGRKQSGQKVQKGNAVIETAKTHLQHNKRYIAELLSVSESDEVQPSFSADVDNLKDDPERDLIVDGSYASWPTSLQHTKDEDIVDQEACLSTPCASRLWKPPQLVKYIWGQTSQNHGNCAHDENSTETTTPTSSRASGASTPGENSTETTTPTSFSDSDSSTLGENPTEPTTPILSRGSGAQCAPWHGNIGVHFFIRNTFITIDLHSEIKRASYRTSRSLSPSFTPHR